ncbi:MAG: hypothetical protein F4Y22_06390 [Gammaproteobacteria bacterium]|nr:hypothetical protein [Gammaproteobacteria bacterium]MYH47660.1 hypothetical protein [Gammaproteobacteria bacterium]MYL14355.1 hypothetical protein [Gammaproteobacteria bacterium]
MDSKETAGTGKENRRREYLALMGIQPWYARVAFENARPSPEYPDLFEAGAEKQAAGSRKSVAAPVEPERATAVEPEPAPVSEPASASAPAAAVVRKPLHYLRVDDSLALLTEDGWQGADAAECRNLLANILKALGKTLDAAAAGEPAHLNRESLDANAGRGGLLADLCKRDGCGNLLVFAFNGNEFFPDVSASVADFTTRFGGVSLRVTVTRGLREMLAFPDLKKYCWRDLQRLRARLR